MKDISNLSSTTWPLKLHTQAKHEILKRYLQAWFPILSTYNGRIIVTIQPYINVIGRINSPVLFNDTYLLNLDEIDGNGISIKKNTKNEHK